MKKIIKKTNSENKNYLPWIVLGIVVFLLVIKLFFKSEFNRNKVIDLHFEPQSIQLQKDSRSNVRIIANSFGKKIAFARIEFEFDPAKINLATDIVTNPNLSTIVQKTSVDTINSTGKAIVVVAANPTDKQPSGIFELATFSINSITTGDGSETGIKFLTSQMQFVEGNAAELEINSNDLNIKLY